MKGRENSSMTKMVVEESTGNVLPILSRTQWRQSWIIREAKITMKNRTRNAWGHLLFV